jgi:hypothetical protein
VAAEVVPIGPAAGSDAHYVHDQSVASAVWTVAHNLGKHPSVSVVDTSGREVTGEVEHVDANNVELTFSAPFSGTAYLN